MSYCKEKECCNEKEGRNGGGILGGSSWLPHIGNGKANKWIVYPPFRNKATNQQQQQQQRPKCKYVPPLHLILGKNNRSFVFSLLEEDEENSKPRSLEGTRFCFLYKLLYLYL